jgi:hypothetical protein
MFPAFPGYNLGHIPGWAFLDIGPIKLNQGVDTEDFPSQVAEPGQVFEPSWALQLAGKQEMNGQQHQE